MRRSGTARVRSLLRPDISRGLIFTVDEVPGRAKLDQNESAIDLPASLKEDLLCLVGMESWNRYGQPSRYYKVKEKFGQAIGFPPERIFLAAGGDDVVIGTFMCVGGKGRKVTYFEPSYPMYWHMAQYSGSKCRRVCLGPEFKVDPGVFRKGDHLVCIASPNNPTGNAQPAEIIIAALKTGALVLLDEAYVDFSGKTLAGLLNDFPNLLIARSLSKSLLAGVRLGYAIGHPEVIAQLEHFFIVPYHLNHLQIVVAENFGLIRPHVNAAAAKVGSERERVSRAMQQLGIVVYPSVANFLLFKPASAARVYEFLLRRGVRIRDVSRLPGLEGHLRVTIGSRQENDMFLDALLKAVRTPAVR